MNPTLRRFLLALSLIPIFVLFLWVTSLQFAEVVSGVVSVKLPSLLPHGGSATLLVDLRRGVPRFLSEHLITYTPPELSPDGSALAFVEYDQDATKPSGKGDSYRLAVYDLASREKAIVVALSCSYKIGQQCQIGAIGWLTATVLWYSFDYDENAARRIQVRRP